MRIFACLAWFDEDPRWLAASAASFAKLADHVIAVDGAYLMYPEGRPASGGEQAESVTAACRANGLGCTLHVPETVWMGNEVEKRNAYVKLAAALGTAHEDWLLVLDGDEEISQVSGLTRGDLEASELSAADVGFWTTDELRSWYGPTRRLYRLLEGMEYGPTHYTVQGTTVSGERVFVNGRGPVYGETLEPALDLTSQVRVEHKHHLRPLSRTRRANEFNELRHTLEPWVPV